MSKIDNSEQVKFLVACIKHASNGRPDFEKVAESLGIVTKGAAQKRYERLIKATNAVIEDKGKNEEIKSESVKSEDDESVISSPVATPKKRKAAKPKATPTPRKKAKVAAKEATPKDDAPEEAGKDAEGKGSVKAEDEDDAAGDGDDVDGEI